MRRFFAIFLLLMYSLSLTGSVLQLHYCGKELVSVKVNALDKQSCCCPMEPAAPSGDCKLVLSVKNECCSETYISFSLEVDQAVQSAVHQIDVLQVVLLPAFKIPSWVGERSVPLAAPMPWMANAPPGGNWQHIPLYELFSRIVYYA